MASGLTRRGGRLGIVAGIAALARLSACGSDAKEAATTGTPAASTPRSSDAASAYCSDHGGTVEERQPFAGTNNDRSQWLELAGQMTMCRFVAKDESRIYVDVDTLAAEQPSLAAAAYLAKVPVTSTGGANPAAVGCSDLGGTSSFGTQSASGGGWVNDDDPAFTVVDMCVFADGSAIDEWGITYYSNGTVRGVDLAPLFRFDASTASVLYPPAR